MMRLTLVSVNFRIVASQLDFHVDVYPRNFEGRWLAVADIGGDHEIGLGWSAREALAALATLERMLAKHADAPPIERARALAYRADLALRLARRSLARASLDEL